MAGLNDTSLTGGARHPAMPRFEPADVRRYYDRHTSAFVAYGHGGDALHRAVWGPGVETREQAFRFVEDRIVEAARDLPGSFASLHIVDLGCGIGGSLCYLASRLPLRGTGLTISPVQVRFAAERIEKMGLADRIRCIEADYTDIPRDVPAADVAYAIESFVHGPSPAKFLAEAARLVRPGGLLIVCDDMRRASADAAAARTLHRFARGWHLNTLVTAEELRDLATAVGFERQSVTDLTPWLELGRARDRAIAVLGTLIGWLPLGSTRAASLVGGAALQKALRRGWLGYDLAVFRLK